MVMMVMILMVMVMMMSMIVAGVRLVVVMMGVNVAGGRLVVIMVVRIDVWTVTWWTDVVVLTVTGLNDVWTAVCLVNVGVWGVAAMMTELVVTATPCAWLSNEDSL